MTTLYDVLDVAPTASEQEIKQAWRLLVRRYHPDTSGDPASMADFERVQHAYEVLSDVERRLAYDRRTFGYSHAGLAALKAQIRRSRKPAPRRGDDIRIVIEVPFERMITGGAETVSGMRLARCEGCDGWCTQDATAPEVCPTCEGEGVTRLGRDDGKAVIRSCGHCGGRGVLIAAPCGVCGATGRVAVGFSREVSLPAGVRDGMQLRIGPGHDGIFEGQAGDLFVVPQVAAHRYYRREGEDLVVTMMVNPLLAVVGGVASPPPLAGEVLPTVPFEPFVGEAEVTLDSPWGLRVRVQLRAALLDGVNEALREQIRALAGALGAPYAEERVGDFTSPPYPAGREGGSGAG